MLAVWFCWRLIWLHLPTWCEAACPPPRAATGTVDVQRNENFGKLRAGYLFPEVRGQGRAAALPSSVHVRKKEKNGVLTTAIIHYPVPGL